MVNSITTSYDAGVGESLSFLFVDEAALIDRLEELWVRIKPTLTTGGRICLASTPNGVGNFFHKVYKGARDGTNGFNCKFGKYINPEDPNEIYDDRLMYWLKPGCNKAWLEAETLEDSPRDIAQERLCSFLASGDTFIDPDTIARLEVMCKEFQPISRGYFDNNFWTWFNPEQNGVYLISCDVSRGDAKDYSAFHVFRMDTVPMEQVAEYKGKIKPDILGELLVMVSQNYNNAIIAPENNSGWSGPTILRIQQLGHGQCLYYTKKRKLKMKNSYGRAPDPYYAEMSNDFLPGFTIHHANRLPVLAKMEQYVRMQHVVIHSERLIDEFKTFIITENGRPEARRGDNDDLIMALGGGIWVRDESFLFVNQNNADVDAMISGISLSNTTTENYKDFSFEKNIYDRGRIERYDEQQSKIRLGNGEEIDLYKWLIGTG